MKGRIETFWGPGTQVSWPLIEKVTMGKSTEQRCLPPLR